MLRVDVPEEDEERIVAAYCPSYAEREFGVVRGTIITTAAPRGPSAQSCLEVGHVGLG